jgi:hypothetical protein
MSEVLIQRVLQMSAPALLAFVKNRGLSRAQLRLVIEDLAAAKQRAKLEDKVTKISSPKTLLGSSSIASLLRPPARR